jgi:hypothetical protein
MNETMVRNVSQVLNIPTGQVPWGPIWTDLLTTLTALLARKDGSDAWPWLAPGQQGTWARR